MRFDKRFLIERCTSSDPTRKKLQHVCIKHAGEDGKEREAFLDATDGRCLVRIPCIVEEADHVGNGMIPALVIRLARRLAILMGESDRPEIRVRLNDDDFRIMGHNYSVSLQRHDIGAFPDTDAIINGQDDGQSGGEAVFDPALLQTVAEAMDATNNGEFRGVIVQAKRGLSPITVKPLSALSPKVIGVIMPMRTT